MRQTRNYSLCFYIEIFQCTAGIYACRKTFPVTQTYTCEVAAMDCSSIKIFNILTLRLLRNLTFTRLGMTGQMLWDNSSHEKEALPKRLS